MAEPVQYRDGSVEFFGLRLKTDARALIPRFETEHLVRQVIAWCATEPTRTWHIVEVGTGSGAIAIALAKHLPLATITAVEISDAAQSLAEENIKSHGLTDRILLLKASLLEPVINRGIEVDIVVANLPYIPTARIPHLDASVRDFEPHTALDGGSDGFDLYRQLLDQVATLAPKPYWCIFEIDDDQSHVSLEETKRRFPDASVSVLKDSSDLNRYLVINLHKPS